MFKSLRKNAILLLLVTPMLAFFGLGPVHAAAPAADPVQLMQQYLTQLGVSADVQTEITTQLQEALNQGADPQQMAELVRLLAKERVRVEDMKHLGETMRGIAKNGTPNIVGLIHSYKAHLQEGMKAGKALDEALDEAEDQAETEQEQLQKQDQEKEHEHGDQDEDEGHQTSANHEREGAGSRND